MGKAVKTGLGIALVWYAPQLAIMATGAMGVGASALAFYATTAAITLVGASITGSALAPKIGDAFGTDQYAGVKLQTHKSNTNPVPIIYGEQRIGSNIIFQETNEYISGSTNKDYWSIQVIANGEVEEYLKLHANDDVMWDESSDIWRLNVYDSLKVYTTSGSSGMDLEDVDFPTGTSGTTTQTGSSIFASSVFPLNKITTNLSDSIMPLAWFFDSDINLGTSAVSAGDWFRFDLSEDNDLTNIKLYVRGSGTITSTVKIQYSDDDIAWTDTGDSATLATNTWNTVTNTHSTNHRFWRVYVNSWTSSYPFLSELDINSSTWTRCKIPANVAFVACHQVFDSADHTSLDNITIDLKGKKIRTITDASTISTTETYSNNPVEIVLDLLGSALAIEDADIDTASFYQAQQDCIANGWTCNIVLLQQANIQSIINDVLSTCRGQIVHSGTKWKLKVDTKSQTSVKTLDDDDFINNSLSISMRGNGDIANKIILKYINPADNWLSAQVVKEDTTLQSWDGQTLEKVIDIKGVTNQTQAEKLAEITLNSMRYSEDGSGNRAKQTPLVLSFATTVKHADLEVGDVITIDSDLLNRNREFVILSVETDQSGLVQISTREYCETHYKDSSGTYLI
mgnify:CR=1 FL=1